MICTYTQTFVVLLLLFPMFPLILDILKWYHYCTVNIIYASYQICLVIRKLLFIWFHSNGLIFTYRTLIMHFLIVNIHVYGSRWTVFLHWNHLHNTKGTDCLILTEYIMRIELMHFILPTNWFVTFIILIKNCQNKKRIWKHVKVFDVWKCTCFLK